LDPGVFIFSDILIITGNICGRIVRFPALNNYVAFIERKDASLTAFLSISLMRCRGAGIFTGI
jgi:hypothetical protein